MKYLAFLFSVYLLALSFVPCSDTAETHDKDATSKIASHSDSTHSHEGTGDICSPFCACACCHSQISIIEIADVLPEEVNFNEISLNEITYLSNYQFTNIDTFLDPPRV